MENHTLNIQQVVKNSYYRLLMKSNPTLTHCSYKVWSHEYNTIQIDKSLADSVRPEIELLSLPSEQKVLLKKCKKGKEKKLSQISIGGALNPPFVHMRLCWPEAYFKIY